MSPPEMFLYIVVGVCNLIIAGQWGKYGFWEIGIQRPPNKAVIGAMLVGVLSLAGYGLYFKSAGQSFPFNKVAVTMIIGIPFLWIYFYRFVILVPGLFEFNSARIRTNYWALFNYMPGERNSDEKGKNLAEFGLAKAAIEKFKKSIVCQGKGQRRSYLQGQQELREEDLEWSNEYRIHCLSCSGETRIPNIRGQKLSGSCSVCGSPMSVLLNGDTALVTTMLFRPVMVVTNGNKLNIAIAYEEMAWLYRMMNLFEEAKVSLRESQTIAEGLFEKEPENRDFLELMSIVFFRRAEIDHITGQKQEAKTGYEKSLEIDTRLGNEEGIITNKILLDRL